MNKDDRMPTKRFTKKILEDGDCVNRHLRCHAVITLGGNALGLIVSPSPTP